MSEKEMSAKDWHLGMHLGNGDLDRLTRRQVQEKVEASPNACPFCWRQWPLGPGEYPRFSVVRLSFPGNPCAYCGTVMGKDLLCQGCGVVDPPTRSRTGDQVTTAEEAGP